MFKLSPSDFAYLYEECKLCYYLKVKYGIYQPSMPMPGVFSTINAKLQGDLLKTNLKNLSESLPDARVETLEGWVESAVVPGTDVFIKGKYDLLAKQKDGSFILVDLKISLPVEDKIEKYKTQLSSYKFALENPKYGKPIKIAKQGLLIFYPDKAIIKKDDVSITFPPKWLEVPIDVEGFKDFAKEVSDLLSGPTPSEGKDCKWCKYRHVGEELSHEANLQEEIPF